MTDIKAQILARRLQRMALEGPSLGCELPSKREHPVVPFARHPAVICEVKRRSPSRGDISPGLKAVDQARHYVESGVLTVSVLTEEDWFKGSLQDLMDVKRAFPQLCVLRKDFLATEEDLKVSWLAGADAVLLIASLLPQNELHNLYKKALELGLEVFMEIHSPEDAQKVRALAPRFTGINSRNLTDFSIDRALPLLTRPSIDWPSKVIYESGIFRLEEAQFASSSGFGGVLVGEAAVRLPALARELTQGFTPWSPTEPLNFWARLLSRKKPTRPLVKICGLARTQDTILADELGVDLLGFILAPSPRQVTPEFIASLPATQALKVGVLTLKEGEEVPAAVVDLLNRGLLDALQFHGNETQELLDAYGTRAYKGLRYQSPTQLESLAKALPPRILVDAFSTHASGGTGQRIPDHELVPLKRALGGQQLWLAGGLNPSNVAEAIRTWLPELIDASSGLEREPGQKDHKKLHLYLREIQNACI